MNIKNALILLFFSLLLLPGCRNDSTLRDKKSHNTTDQYDYQQIRNGLEKYVQSISNADSVEGSSLFAQSGEVTFIHPRGHDSTWTQISASIYRFFKDNFDNRDLRFYNEKITVYDQSTAWVEFYWTFHATMKGDTTNRQTMGRETQIWRKINSEWRLVHIHYSALPDNQ